MSLIGFFLRHPNVIDTAEPLLPPRNLAEAMDRFRRYGYELQILEHDLTECVNEFNMACENYYANPKRSWANLR